MNKQKKKAHVIALLEYISDHADANGYKDIDKWAVEAILLLRKLGFKDHSALSQKGDKK